MGEEMKDGKKERELENEELLEMLILAVQNSIEYFVINKDEEFIAKIPKLQKACLQIHRLIQKKSKIDETWLEEKAEKMANIIIPFHAEKSITNFMADPIERCKDFINSILRDVHGRIPEVDEAFIAKWQKRMENYWPKKQIVDKR